jgi:hypothetical protein
VHVSSMFLDETMVENGMLVFKKYKFAYNIQWNEIYFLLFLNIFFVWFYEIN